MFCSECGLKMPTGSKFCARCGTILMAGVQQENQTANYQSFEENQEKTRQELEQMEKALAYSQKIGMHFVSMMKQD